MQTKIRVIEQINPSEFYKHITFDILEKDKYGRLLSIGWVRWQGDKDRDYWYAFEFQCVTKESDNLLKLAKLAKFVENNADVWNIQPTEFEQLVEAKRYFYYHSEYIPESYKGMKYYRVNKDGEFYSHIYAANDIQARKQFTKKFNDNYKLDFKEIIN